MSETISTPRKKRRGRPSLRKNQQSSNIGESTIQLSLNSTEGSNAFEQSEATAKKGFQSTPMMRLSPAKDLKYGKDEQKGILQEINSSSKSFNNSMNRTQSKKGNKTKDLMFIHETQSILSSSPMSNIMTSDGHIPQSSPLNTSPMARDKVSYLDKDINNTYDNNNDDHQVHDSVDLLQSSPIDGITENNDHYDEQFMKFINSSPVCTTNTPKPKNDYIPAFESKFMNKIQQKLEKESHALASLSPRLSKEKPGSKHSKTICRRVSLNNHRFNYKYKLTLDINAYGEARILARLFENKHLTNEELSKLYQQYISNVTQNKRESAETPKDHRSDIDWRNEEFPTHHYRDDTGVKVNILNRYEEYINERRSLNETRKRILDKCMKNDAFLTSNVYLNYRDNQDRREHKLDNRNSRGIASVESSPFKRTFISAGLEGRVLLDDMLDLDSLPNVPSNDALRALHNILREI